MLHLHASREMIGIKLREFTKEANATNTGSAHVSLVPVDSINGSLSVCSVRNPSAGVQPTQKIRR